MSRLKSIVDGPANLREKPDGKIVSSIPDKEQVDIDYCSKEKRWVRVLWKNHDGWTSAQNLPKLNLQVDCEIFNRRD